MTGQTSLLDPVPSVPRPLVDFLAGVAGRYAFGERPTEPQKRAAAVAAERMAVVLADLKATRS